jgi:oligoendopeptidase F
MYISCHGVMWENICYYHRKLYSAYYVAGYILCYGFVANYRKNDTEDFTDITETTLQAG